MALATITARGLSRRTMLAAPLLVGRGARGFRIGGGLASLGLPRVGRAPVVPSIGAAASLFPGVLEGVKPVTPVDGNQLLNRLVDECTGSQDTFSGDDWSTLQKLVFSGDLVGTAAALAMDTDEDEQKQDERMRDDDAPLSLTSTHDAAKAEICSHLKAAKALTSGLDGLLGDQVSSKLAAALALLGVTDNEGLEHGEKRGAETREADAKAQRQIDLLTSPAKKKGSAALDDDATPVALDADVNCLFSANGGLNASDCTLLRELFPQIYASDDLMKSEENRFQNRLADAAPNSIFPHTLGALCYDVQHVSGEVAEGFELKVWTTSTKMTLAAILRNERFGNYTIGGNLKYLEFVTKDFDACCGRRVVGNQAELLARPLATDAHGRVMLNSSEVTIERADGRRALLGDPSTNTVSLFSRDLMINAYGDKVAMNALLANPWIVAIDGTDRHVLYSEGAPIKRSDNKVDWEWRTWDQVLSSGKRVINVRCGDEFGKFEDTEGCKATEAFDKSAFAKKYGLDLSTVASCAKVFAINPKAADMFIGKLDEAGFEATLNEKLAAGRGKLAPKGHCFDSRLVTGGSVEELLGPFNLTYAQFKQCADANKFPEGMTYWMHHVGAADGSGSALPGADWRQARVFAAATCGAEHFNKTRPFDRAAAVGADVSANAWPALSSWFGRDAYSNNHDGILGPLVGEELYTINGQALKVGDPVLKVLYETNTSVVLGVAKIAEFKGGAPTSAIYDHALVMSQTNVEKCKKDHPSRVMAQAVIAGDFDEVGVKLLSRPSKGLGRNAQILFNLPDSGPPVPLPFRVVLGTDAVKPPGKKAVGMYGVGMFFTAPSDVRLGDDVFGPSESSEVAGPLGSCDFTTSPTVTYAASDGFTNTVAGCLFCGRTGGTYGVFSNAEMLTKLASMQSTRQLDEDSPFSALGGSGPLKDVDVKLRPGTKASLVPTKAIHQKALFELLEDHERAANDNPGVLPLHDSYNRDGLVLQAAVEGVVIGEVIALRETFRARNEEAADQCPTIENVLAAERLGDLIDSLVEASCRDGLANEPARCSSAVDVAVVIIAQLMEAAETNAEALQRVESSQQPRRAARLDLTKFDFELATNKGSDSRPDWQFESAAKWTLKKIGKHGDGADLRFTKAGRDSPPINVSDISDIALSAAQLDRRVRFKAGKPAGATLVKIIQEHFASA